MSLAVYENVHDKKHHIFVRIEDDRDEDVPAHFHRNIEILYIIEGRIQTTINEKTYVVNQNEILFIPSYIKHDFFRVTTNGQSEHYKKIFIVIPFEMSGDFSNFFLTQSFDPVLKDTSFNRKLLPVIYKMRLEYLASLNAKPHSQPFINLYQKGYADMLIGKLLHHYPLHQRPKKTNQEFITQVLSYIDDHFKQDLTLEDLSKRFGYNKCYFSKIFNQYIGKNLTSYINTVRVQRLVDDNKIKDYNHISQLASEYGFDSLTTFYRYFKILYNDSPKNILK